MTPSQQALIDAYWVLWAELTKLPEDPTGPAAHARLRWAQSFVRAMEAAGIADEE